MSRMRGIINWKRRGAYGSYIAVIARSHSALAGSVTKQSLNAIFAGIMYEIVRRDCFVAPRSIPFVAPRNDGDGDPFVVSLPRNGTKSLTNNYFVF